MLVRHYMNVHFFFLPNHSFHFQFIWCILVLQLYWIIRVAVYPQKLERILQFHYSQQELPCVGPLHPHTSSDFTFLLQLLPATLLPENVKLLGQLWRVPQQVCRQHPASPAWLLRGPRWGFVWGSSPRLWTEPQVGTLQSIRWCYLPSWGEGWLQDGGGRHGLQTEARRMLMGPF